MSHLSIVKWLDQEITSISHLFGIYDIKTDVKHFTLSSSKNTASVTYKDEF